MSHSCVEIRRSRRGVDTPTFRQRERRHWPSWKSILPTPELFFFAVEYFFGFNSSALALWVRLPRLSRRVVRAVRCAA